MASAFSHAFVAFAFGKLPQRPPFTWRMLILGMVCSVVPDLDVIGFSYGIPYEDLWGHRGITHSLVFAGLLSASLVASCCGEQPLAKRTAVFVYLFLCTASHGLLDAMTDGGLGVAFFSPFDTTRYFFGFHPVAVSPIGIGEFFSRDAVGVLASEARWIWLPTVAMVGVLRILQCFRSGRLNPPHNAR